MCITFLYKICLYAKLALSLQYNNSHNTNTTKVMAHEHIYQELGETTDAQISFTVAYSGKYYVKTNLDLKGRGIRPNGEAPNGKKTYYVTDVALEKLKTQYSTSFLADL